MLKSFGVGIPGQRILDLGTGAGSMALHFADAGAIVTALDISDGQVEEARRQAAARALDARFIISSAESNGQPDASFDVITASQSWLYFDSKRMIPEVKRLLAPDGVLMTSHMYWLPRRDAIARASERLVLQYNPRWSHANVGGDVSVLPSWAEGHFSLDAMFVFDEKISFTRESWRGRFRACRAIGATLTPEETEAFDRDHDALLKKIASEQFSVLHRIDAHILRPAV